METDNLYNFIEKEKFEKIVKKLSSEYQVILKRFDFFKNRIDPFSALAQMFFQDRDFDSWEIVERDRQLQKSLQNKIGDFHQNLIANMTGWKEAPKIGDAINEEKKMIVEVKNKYNTEKGEKKAKVYDNLATLLKDKKYSDYKAYYLYIIRKGEFVNKPFEPSDNQTKSRRKKREDIREIDGISFYTLVTDDKLFLKKIYIEMFNVLKEVSGKSNLGDKIKGDDRFEEYFDKTFN